MQDTSGEIRDLTPFLKDIPEVDPKKFAELLSKSTELEAAIQEAKDKVQPDRSKQGPVFMVGEELEIKGGRFLITKLEPGHMKLKSLPKL